MSTGQGLLQLAEERVALRQEVLQAAGDERDASQADLATCEPAPLDRFATRHAFRASARRRGVDVLRGRGRDNDRYDIDAVNEGRHRRAR